MKYKSLFTTVAAMFIMAAIFISSSFAIPGRPAAALPTSEPATTSEPIDWKESMVNAACHADDRAGLEAEYALGAAPFAALGFISYHGMTAVQFVITWLRSELIEPRQLAASAVNNIYYEATKDTIAAFEKEGYRRNEQNRQKHSKARSRK